MAKATIDFAFQSEINAAQHLKCKQICKNLLRTPVNIAGPDDLMSHPFVIWTLQRTGGTALADRLMALSEHPGAEHEPFNWSRDRPRPFWPVVARWTESRDAAALARDLDGILGRGTLVKHCYELFPMAFNLALLDAAARARYRHLLLLRRDEGARLISKFIAEAQGTWFEGYAREVYAAVGAERRQLRPVPVDQAVAQFEHARNATAALRRAFAERGIVSDDVTFEALYLADRPVRARSFAAVLDHLGFAAEDRAAETEAFLEATKRGGQRTAAVLHRVPNIAALVQGLAAAGCPVPADLARRDLIGNLVAQLSRLAAERHWIFEENVDGAWPGLALRFSGESGLPFRIESADNSFNNVYFGIRSRDATPNKSLDEALTLALGQATTSDTWPWCRHPDPDDDILPVDANWATSEALSRGVPDGSLAARIVAAAERFRAALIGAGALAVPPNEWLIQQGLAPLAGSPARPTTASPPPGRAPSLFAAGYLAGLGLAAETILDVGVRSGTKELYDAFQDRRFVLIDPQRDGEALLEARPRHYRFVAKALGRQPGRARLSDDGAKSTLLERTALTADGPVSRYDVEITTLDAIIGGLDGTGPVGIKLDTEGYETEIVAGLDLQRHRVEWMICEASIRVRFVDGYGFSDLVASMRDKGFMFYNVLGRLQRRPLFYDVLFLKTGHPLFD